jgi:poly(hydroxyalkanoate) depolymerase family esterase
MTALPMADMIEATRLTREGRLNEAMAVLRGPYRSASSSSAASDFVNGAGHPAAGRTPPTLDMVPPSIATGDSWTPQLFSEPPAASPFGGMRQPKVAEALRGVFGRIGDLESAGGLGGGSASFSLPEGARFEERTYANASGRRGYKLYVPSTFAGRPLPLVIMLHGCGQSPDDFAAGTRMNDLAEEQSFIVAYPAQTPSANISKCWNWFRSGDQQRDRGEPSLLAGITRQVMREFSVEPARVYIAGLSAGGAAAAIMGSTYPDLYAAVGVHSGLACGAASDLTSALAAMRQGGSQATGSPRAIPTIVFHGDRDTTVNPINGDQVIAQSKGSANLRTAVDRGAAKGGINYTRTVSTDDSGRPVLEQWVLHGAGHAWSGGSAAGSYTEPRGPDASREMMRFFVHCRPPTVS